MKFELRTTNCIKSLMFVALTAIALTGCKQSKYEYETVDGDVLNTKLYTLKNGLKVYMTVNKEQPRIQTFIAVHVGSKHEPAETTGLAHYLEHMLFKGSTNFGTTNYKEEKPLLDKISDLYEVYRKTTDPAERKAIYHQIDSISYEASSYFIPNEYDKLMAHIGSDGSNAYTSYDQTVYTEDIPSNQIENWAKIQSDRFKNMVLRGFHTELEAVYEEYNKYLNSDWDKIADATFGALTPTHPYNHSVIGFGEHLKNPSIKNIEAFFHEYYVPNNMAICLSGDFDPDDMIDIIEKYFGDMQPNKNLKMPTYDKQPELKEVAVREVVTPNPENISLCWRFDGAKSHQNDTLQVLSSVLSNGKAGLLDLDLNLTQKVNASDASSEALCDYSVLTLAAQPQPGQSLDELRTLLMQEVQKLRDGQFTEELVKSVITESKLNQQKMLEENRSRADAYVRAFVDDIDWKDAVGEEARISKLTKKDIVAFAKKHLMDNNYVCIYKRQGEDKSIKPVDKPAITPIKMNRDTVSAFAKEILESEVKPIEPVFLDYQKDLSFFETESKLPVIYRKNTLNDICQVTYRYDFGTCANRQIELATDYLSFIGTDSMSAEDFQKKLYLLGCKMDCNVSWRNVEINISGLQENIPEAMRLVDNLLNNAKVDSTAYQNLVVSKLQERQNIMQMFDYYTYFLRNYLMYGQAYSDIELTNDELQKVDAQQLVDDLHQLSHFKHQVLFYGPADKDEALKMINEEHKVSDLVDCPVNKVPALLVTKENECFVYPYKGTTSFVMNQYACTGKTFDENTCGAVNMYNEYFGAGMNTVVFQEMREKRSLCYGAGARYSIPMYKNLFYTYSTQIQSQNDKLADCISVFADIVNNMPCSETAFQISKQGLLTQLRTERTTRNHVIESYLQAKEMGIDYDIRQKVYEQVQNITLNDIKKFQQENVKGLQYRSGFAGDPTGMDASQLNKLGTVKTLTAHEMFGF